MAEVIEGYSMVFTSIVNFLFSLDFGDGTTVGGFMLAVCALSLIIRFLFRSIQAGPSTFAAYRSHLSNEATRQANESNNESYANQYNKIHHPKSR